jgi:hypothetical protein
MIAAIGTQNLVTWEQVLIDFVSNLRRQLGQRRLPVYSLAVRACGLEMVAGSFFVNSDNEQAVGDGANGVSIQCI